MDSCGRSCYFVGPRTLIEAALAGKPVHRFSPEPFPAALEAEWHSLVPELNDREAFLGAMWAKPPSSQRESPLPTGRERGSFQLAILLMLSLKRSHGFMPPRRRTLARPFLIINVCGGDGSPSNICANESSACQCWSGTTKVTTSPSPGGQRIFLVPTMWRNDSRWQQVLQTRRLVPSPLSRTVRRFAQANGNVRAWRTSFDRHTEIAWGEG